MKKLFLLFILFFLSNTLYSQNPKWLHYEFSQDIHCVVSEGNTAKVNVDRAIPDDIQFRTIERESALCTCTVSLARCRARYDAASEPR